MADFRKCLLAFALVTMLVTLANANVVTHAPPALCTITAGNSDLANNWNTANTPAAQNIAAVNANKNNWNIVANTTAANANNWNRGTPAVNIAAATKNAAVSPPAATKNAAVNAKNAANRGAPVQANTLT